MSSSRPACSPYTCQSLQSLCGPQSPAAHCPASDLCRKNPNSKSHFLSLPHSTPFSGLGFTCKWFLWSGGTGAHRWSQRRRSCKKRLTRRVRVVRPYRHKGVSDGWTYVALCKSNLWQFWMWNMRSPPFRYSITKKRFSWTRTYREVRAQRGCPLATVRADVLPWSGRCSKGVWGKDSPRPKRGPSAPPWCTRRHRPSAPRPFLEPSRQRTGWCCSVRLKTPENITKTKLYLFAKVFQADPFPSYCLLLLYLSKAAFPEHLVQDEVV